MAEQDLILLLNPAIACILGAALAIISHYRPAAKFMRSAAIGMFAFAAAFVVQDILPAAPYRLTNLATNLLFLTAVSLLFVTMVELAGGKAPAITLLSIAIATAAAIVWFLYVDDLLAYRIHTMNISHTIMGIIALTCLLMTRPRNGWGWALAIIVTVIAVANFGWRPLLVFWEGNFYADTAGLHGSLYWNTTRLASPIIAVAAAISLMVGLAIRILKELKFEAIEDKLSGCFNRRGFEEQALLALNGRVRETPASLILCDIDNFKSINDRLGHGTGDQVIVCFGQALRQAMPADAIIGRIGGEEFAVLNLKANARNASRYAADLQREFSQSLRENGLVPATVSVGIYNAGVDEDLSAMMTKADKALYDAKNAGKNCIKIGNAALTTVASQVIFAR